MADAGQTSSAAASEIHGGEGERGGGGKLRRERKPPATPYDRPPRRWISRFVDPAKRLFSGLPSLFSPVSTSVEIADEVQSDEEQEAEDAKENCLVNHVVSKSSGGVGPSKVKGNSKLDFTDEDGLDKSEGFSGGGVPDIEQLIKGKTFSREDIDHLMKILHSKVVDAEQGIKTPNFIGQYEVEKAETSSERQKTYVDEEEDLNRYHMTTSTSLSRPAMQDEISASPVDIARAYMGSKTSEMGFTPTSFVPKSDKIGFSSDFSSQPAMPSPLQKAPICWPGAVTQNQLNYSTPQSRNSRSGFHSFPRTPYSRTVFSKSKSKLTPLHCDNERFPSVTPAPFQPTPIPVYGKSMNNKTEDSYGSGGPVRRMRNKFTSATPSRESTLFRTAQRSPFARESNVDFTPKKIFEPGSSSTAIFNSVTSKGKSPEVGVYSAHPHSSRVARHILEQIDRPITVKQNSEELKLATSWKNSSASALATPVQNISSSSTPGVMADKNKNTFVVNFPAQTNGENNVLLQERTNTISGAGKDIFGSTSLDKRGSIVGASSGPSSSLKIFDSHRSSEQGISNDLPKTSLFTGASNKAAALTNSPARPEPQNSHRKPMLNPIAIEKSSMGTSFSSATASGFTFSFNTSSTTSAEPEPEPPTPSIMPSFLTSSPQQSKVSADLPTHNSTNKITIAPPVVSFQSKTKAFTPNDDASAPKFKFGSEKPRLSFAVAEDDAAPTLDSAIPNYKFGSGKGRLNFGSIGSSDALCC